MSNLYEDQVVRNIVNEAKQQFQRMIWQTISREQLRKIIGNFDEPGGQNDKYRSAFGMIFEEGLLFEKSKDSYFVKLQVTKSEKPLLIGKG